MDCRQQIEKPSFETNCTNCDRPVTKKHSDVKNSVNYFCNRSCAATYNNKSRIISNARKRKPNFCKECERDITHERGDGKVVAPGKHRLCIECHKNKKAKHPSVNAMKETGMSIHNIHAYIRGRARTIYKQSGKEHKCKACGYELHVDIAHIVPIKSFNHDTHVDKINHIDNLVALCKNHHWEFDNGHLEKAKLMSS